MRCDRTVCLRAPASPPARRRSRPPAPLDAPLQSRLVHRRPPPRCPRGVAVARGPSGCALRSHRDRMEHVHVTRVSARAHSKPQPPSSRSSKQGVLPRAQQHPSEPSRNAAPESPRTMRASSRCYPDPADRMQVFRLRDTHRPFVPSPAPPHPLASMRAILSSALALDPDPDHGP